MKIFFRFQPYLLALSFIIPSLSLGVFGLDIPRVVFKAIGSGLIVSLLLFILLSGRQIRVRCLQLVFLISGFFFIFFVSEFFALSESGMIISLFRFLVVFSFCLVIFMLTREELKKSLQATVYILSTISLIGVFLYLFNYNGGEKIPVLNNYSNKSIVFEQNVYGISVYILFIYFIFNKKSLYVSLLPLFAVFTSYYRTVYFFSLARISIYKVHFTALLLIPFLIIVAIYSDQIYNLLRLDQVSTLTGRDMLWSIAISGFLESPLIGLGESSIPIYSNLFLNRTPAFTTYHNIFLDVLYINGIAGFLYLIIMVFLYYRLLGLRNIIYGSFLMAPAIFNTYYPFSFNILGGFLGLIIVSHYRCTGSAFNGK